MGDRLEDIAAAMVAPGKGILAADESGGTITKRFKELGINSTEDTRRDYRELMFRQGDAGCGSSVILCNETIRRRRPTAR
jgi:fructose-bisphosphate aldolase class I